MKTKSLFMGMAAFLVCGAVWGLDFSSRAYECPPDSTVFASVFQRFASLKNNDGPHTRYNPTAGAVGYVYNNGRWEAGAAFSYEHGTRKYDGSGESYRVRSNTAGISLFGTMRFADGWYAGGSGFVGFANYKPKNLSGFGDGEGIDKTVFALGLEAGKVFAMGNGFLVTPHFGLDYAYTPSESHRWDRNGNRQRRSLRSQDYWEIPLGVSFSKTFALGAWRITPRADATLVTSLGGMDAMNRQPGFAYRTAQGWKVAGVGGDHLGGRFTAGVNANLNRRTEIGLDYTYEVRKKYNDHRLSAVVGWSF